MCSNEGCRGRVSTRSVRIRAAVLLMLSVASLALIVTKGDRSHGPGRANSTDLAFRRDAAAQRLAAAALLRRLDRTETLRKVRVLLTTESGNAVTDAPRNAPRLRDLSGAVRRHFEGDMLLARIEVASGADRDALADAQLLLQHGRRGIAELPAA